MRINWTSFTSVLPVLLNFEVYYYLTLLSYYFLPQHSPKYSTMKPLKKMRTKLIDAQYYFQILPNVERTNFVKTVSAKKLSLVIKKYSLTVLKISINLFSWKTRYTTSGNKNRWFSIILTVPWVTLFLKAIPKQRLYRSQI